MDREVRLRELLIGVEGLALLRGLYDGPVEQADQRLAEVRRILDEPEFASGELTSEQDARVGYRAWSARYDEPGNPMIDMEQPAVWGLLADIPPGEALDAACGTGRHARHLVELGHRVTGVDLTPEMLDVARESVPQAQFTEGDLCELPFGEDSFDLVVSGLAVAHVAELDKAISELARVLRPGGRLVISALHPFQAHLGWHAPFQDAAGNRGFVREHAHSHADYFAAFTAAGLQVRACLEPRLDVDQVRAKRRAYRAVPEAALAAYLGLPGALVWDVQR
ncbi:hypothetical protein GCM10010174_29650 [Kutzneria viridogrisea]|uniref:Methyltransferase type 11 domain-containing protein n=2 Tax=Kutzneria TaxID=43356 RepID=W5WIA1_9PSEU|nr:class I SAM-dependent methyltransferase [Kutzneria albida]AHH97889.1 hypothetical protein KALB_4527 [Kutzneria albida DSM 43870]MBA8924458.1 SAM-dependent methyltransferase [Kutzneria viridogrisea]